MCLPLSWVMEKSGNCNLLWAVMEGREQSSAAKHSLAAGNQGSRVDFLGFTAWEWLWGKSQCFSHAHCPLHAVFPAALGRSSAKPKILIGDFSAIHNHAENPLRFTSFSQGTDSTDHLTFGAAGPLFLLPAQVDDEMRAVTFTLMEASCWLSNRVNWDSEPFKKHYF